MACVCIPVDTGRNPIQRDGMHRRVLPGEGTAAGSLPPPLAVLRAADARHG
jgi:hypothetical protein